MTEQQKTKLISLLERMIARHEILIPVERYLQSLEEPDYDPELQDDFDINKVDFNSDPELDREIDELLEEMTVTKI